MAFPLRVDDEIELRVLTERDADALFALVDANRDHLREWLPWVDGSRSSDDTRAFIRESREQMAKGALYPLGTWYRGQVAGGMGLRVDVQSRRAEIGYWLAQPLQGRGIVTRAVRALTTAGFEELGLHRIQILCATGNVRSCAVAKRLGYRLEGVLRGFELVGDRFNDLRAYAMLAPEWDPT
jgi:ribosomal-protein-serine acetyltransferase